MLRCARDDPCWIRRQGSFEPHPFTPILGQVAARYSGSVVVERQKTAALKLPHEAVRLVDRRLENVAPFDG